MDVVENTSSKEAFRCLIDKKGHIVLTHVPQKEANIKPLKVVNKSKVKGGKIQVTAHDGRNFLFDKTEINVGDTIIFDLEKKKIVEVLPFAKNSLVLLTDGSHIGHLAKIKEVIRPKNLQKPKVVIDMDGNEYTTLMGYGFVIGKEKPYITIEDKK